MSRNAKQVVFIVFAALVVFGGIYMVSRPKSTASTSNTATSDAATQKQISDLVAKVKADPKDVASLIALGSLYFDNQMLKQSEDSFKSAVDLDPNNVDLHVKYGLSIFWQGTNPEGALAEFQKAISLDPKNTQAHYYLAVGLSHKGDTVGSLAEYQKVVDIGPDTPEGKKALDAINKAKAAASGTPGPGGTPSTSSTPSAANPHGTTLPGVGKVGDSLTLGSAVVKVSNIKDWAGDASNQAGDGQRFIQISVSVTNQGTSPLSVSSGNFALLDSSNTPIAVSAADPDKDRFAAKDLAKGDTSQGSLVFLVKKDDKNLKLIYLNNIVDQSYLTFQLQ